MTHWATFPRLSARKSETVNTFLEARFLNNGKQPPSDSDLGDNGQSSNNVVSETQTHEPVATPFQEGESPAL
ncbi:hypothetical protein Lepto7375DRAFT_5407 [Leptolyngbya sp. PCC 7375]|nr:hypothetical protein Lepto7375DRAFT_5407 [Leptolyngbya sp. PCC 7375]